MLSKCACISCEDNSYICVTCVGVWSGGGCVVDGRGKVTGRNGLWCYWHFLWCSLFFSPQESLQILRWEGGALHIDHSWGVALWAFLLRPHHLSCEKRVCIWTSELVFPFISYTTIL